MTNETHKNKVITIVTNIQPVSRVQTKHKNDIEAEIATLEIGNGRGKMLQTLLDRGTDNDAAIRISQAFYRIVPLWVFLTDKMIETVANAWTGEGFGFPDTFVKELGKLIIQTRKPTQSTT